MKFKKEMLLLYAVTDRHWTGGQTLEEQIEEALTGGVTIAPGFRRTLSSGPPVRR